MLFILAEHAENINSHMSDNSLQKHIYGFIKVAEEYAEYCQIQKQKFWLLKGNIKFG